MAATEPFGACMCKEFADGRFKTLHNWGQPGCKHKLGDVAKRAK
jgi:hypothetical protein